MSVEFLVLLGMPLLGAVVPRRLRRAALGAGCECRLQPGDIPARRARSRCA